MFGWCFVTSGDHCASNSRPPQSRGLRVPVQRTPLLASMRSGGTKLGGEAFRRRTVTMAPVVRRKLGDGDAESWRGDEDHELEEEVERSEEEQEVEEEEEGEDEEITEYEKQRLKTIERNKAMLASLELPSLASSLAQTFSSNAAKTKTTSKSQGGGPRRRSERLKSVSGKRSALDDEGSSSDKSDSESESLSPNKRKRKDQEYEPTDEEGSSESEDDMDEHENEVLQEDASPNGADMDEEEYALQQALALSLGASVEATDSPGPSKRKKKGSSGKKRAAKSTELEPDDELEDEPKLKPSKGNAKRKTQKMSNKRHFTEGEVDALFPFFDEKGRGQLTLNDLERVSTAHDFTWSQQELLDMIHLFNRSHTGVLDLVDFRNVAHRCNLVVSER